MPSDTQQTLGSVADAETDGVDSPEFHQPSPSEPTPTASLGLLSGWQASDPESITTQHGFQRFFRTTRCGDLLTLNGSPTPYFVTGASHPDYRQTLNQPPGYADLDVTIDRVYALVEPNASSPTYLTAESGEAADHTGYFVRDSLQTLERTSLDRLTVHQVPQVEPLSETLTIETVAGWVGLGSVRSEEYHPILRWYGRRDPTRGLDERIELMKFAGLDRWRARYLVYDPETKLPHEEYWFPTAWSRVHAGIRHLRNWMTTHQQSREYPRAGGNRIAYHDPQDE